MDRRFKLLFGIVVWGLGFPVFAAESSKKTLKIAVAYRPVESIGAERSNVLTGYEAAIALFKKKHPEINIESRSFEHGSEITSVVETADKIRTAKIPAVIGGGFSDDALVLGDRFAAQDIVLVTPTASNPDVTKGRPNVFRLCISDDLVAERLARFVANTLRPARIGVVHNVSSAYADFLTKSFLQEFERVGSNKAGFQIVVEKVLRNQSDYSPVIRRFQRAGVTHVVILNHSRDTFYFVSQANRQNFYPIYIGSDGWGTNKTIQENLVTQSDFGKKFIGYRNAFWKEQATFPLQKELIQILKHSKGHMNASVAIAFDATWVLLNAMSRAKNPSDGPSIRQSLLDLKKFPGATSKDLSFHDGNSPIRSLYMYRIDAEGVHFVSEI